MQWVAWGAWAWAGSGRQDLAGGAGSGRQDLAGKGAGKAQAQTQKTRAMAGLV